jgi:predicted phage terminase large subunit-like protein
VFFPHNRKDRWNEFYTALYEYQREGKSKYDDAPDALTGITENIERAKELQFC